MYRGLYLPVYVSIFPKDTQEEGVISGTLWDSSRGSQRVPEEELKSEINGKVARNNGLKNDFFQFLT